MATEYKVFIDPSCYYFPRCDGLQASKTEGGQETVIRVFFSNI